MGTSCNDDRGFRMAALAFVCANRAVRVDPDHELLVEVEHVAQIGGPLALERPRCCRGNGSGTAG